MLRSLLFILIMANSVLSAIFPSSMCIAYNCIRLGLYSNSDRMSLLTKKKLPKNLNVDNAFPVV